MANNLVAYYSWSGNTKAIAETIHRQIGGTLFEIQPSEPYTNNYDAVVDQAKKEIQQGYVPALQTTMDSIEDYDAIYIGTPNWWSTLAPPVKTFLTKYSFAGKTIIPFISHGGGGMARCEKDMAQLCARANILKGLAIYNNGGAALEKEVTAWLNKIQKN